MNNKKKVVLIVLLAIIVAVGIKLISDSSKKETNLSIEKNKTETNVESKKETNAESNVKNKTETSDINNSHPNHEGEFYLTDENELKKIVKDSKPTILMFGSKYCHYCNIMRPYTEKIANELKDKVNIRYIDVDNNPEIAHKYPIKGTPAMAYYYKEEKPYQPSEKYTKYGFYQYSKKGSNELALTMSYGLIEENIFREIIEEVLNGR